MVRYYNPHESTILSLFRWRYTLTSSVFFMGEFWIYMILALLVMVLMDLGVVGLPSGVVGLDVWKLLGPQLSLTIFAVVFYNNQCYGRYMSLYSSCVDIEISAKNFASELLVDFGHDPDLQGNIRQACKYCLAAVFYFYLSQKDDLNMDGSLPITWQIIQDKGLLTEAEVQQVGEFPGAVFTLLLHWANVAVKDGIRKLRAADGKPGQYKPPELAAMSSRLYSSMHQIGASCDKVRSIQNMPVPFSYFHLLNILISVTVLATGFGSLILVEQQDSPTFCLAFFPYAVVTFAFLALRQLSGELADPFGQDTLDFPTADFMRHVYDNVVAMLAMHERYNVLQALQGQGLDFTEAMVQRPCFGKDKEHRDLTKLLKPQQGQHGGPIPSRGCMARLWKDDEIGGYGPRYWVKPEDFHGAARLIRWLGGDKHQVSDKVHQAASAEEDFDAVPPPKVHQASAEEDFDVPRKEKLPKSKKLLPKSKKQLVSSVASMKDLQIADRQRTEGATQPDESLKPNSAGS